MTKTEQLAAYLPFNLMCLVDGNQIAELCSVYSDGQCCFHDIVESEQGFENIKPILKPLYEVDWDLFIDDNLSKMSDAIRKFIIYFNSDLANQDVVILSAPYIVFRWCLENHYDVFGLIEKGEAIQSNN